MWLKHKLTGNQYKLGGKKDNNFNKSIMRQTRIITPNEFQLRGEQPPHRQSLSKDTETALSPQEWDSYTLRDKLIIRTMKQAIENQTVLSDVQAESGETAWLRGRWYQ